MKTFKYEFKIKDKFRKGDCDNCPCAVDLNFYETHSLFCVFDGSYQNCPLKEIKDD